jgi:hypothetical protein
MLQFQLTADLDAVSATAMWDVWISADPAAGAGGFGARGPGAGPGLCPFCCTGGLQRTRARSCFRAGGAAPEPQPAMRWETDVDARRYTVYSTRTQQDVTECVPIL